MGGGGEPKGNSTIFDTEIRTLGNYFNKNKDWNVNVAFNGGHSKTEEILTNGLGKAAGLSYNFTQSEFDRLIGEYETKIRSGEIKPGEQLLVYISTHGALARPTEKTHSIAASGGAALDLNNLAGTTLISLDKLQELSDLAADKGVKLGIVDSSCHAGNTIKLRNDKTCIITASGPTHFGYSSFGDRLAGNMKKGKSLEDVFLDTFVNRNETAFPMISTNTGVKLQDDLYDLITPFLYSYDNNHDKLKAYLEKEVMDNKCQQAEESFNKIIALSQDMERAFNGKKSDFRKFREDLTQYFHYQNKIRNDLEAMNIRELGKKEQFCTEIIAGTKKSSMCYSYSLKEILSMDVDAEIKRYQEIKTKEPSSANWIDFTLGNFSKIKDRKAELLRESPQYVRYMEYYQKELPRFERDSWSKAMAVSRSLQKVYASSYRAMAREDRGPNPCKYFVL
jgi:uncharacterized protein YeaO (DUF488 family)